MAILVFFSALVLCVFEIEEKLEPKTAKKSRQPVDWLEVCLNGCFLKVYTEPAKKVGAALSIYKVL